MNDQVLRLLDPSALVSIPWHLRSKVGGPHLLQSWDQTHHHFIRQVGEDLLHLQCHSYLQVQAALVDHSFIKPLQNLLALQPGNPRASIAELKGDFTALVILQLA